MSVPTELLSTVVEFSIGLAGFSGVIGIFTHGSGQWHYVDRFRLTNLLFMSLAPGFLSFFTLGLLEASYTSEAAVKLSAGVFAALLVITLILIPRSRLKVPEQHKYLVGPQIFVPMVVTVTTILTLQILLAFSMFKAQAFTVYYYCLVALLLLAVVQFTRLILARPEEPA